LIWLRTRRPSLRPLRVAHRSHETALHSKRDACHALVLAKHFTTDPQRLCQIYYGTPRHVIGKIGILDAILLKDGALTNCEWQMMHTHPEIEHRFLASAPFMGEAVSNRAQSRRTL
jgi:HD-GYP domain-containing protein (c-di-GMP phosphodiesterase class II)